MADDDLTAELDRIKERHATLGPLYQNPHFMLDAVVQDVPRLLAALRAVLELTEPSGEVHRDLDGNEETGVVRVVRCAKVREAITREITGKGAGDE